MVLVASILIKAGADMNHPCLMKKLAQRPNSLGFLLNNGANSEPLFGILSIKALQTLLTTAGCSTRGKKDELISRYVEHCKKTATDEEKEVITLKDYVDRPYAIAPVKVKVIRD
eukprot:TRINITY_DN4808_c0_g5_i2.p1 TRINITY_DN4808_c0_g5~~TRINITY_DN4808_c0_g5_i2.p1  ORF type:complete len:114 (-),score=26.53 TRINITY_DN4808_c0_g5_i2:660-1001(-)